MKPFTYFALGLLLALAIAQCAGCSALTQMSDSWCAEHPNAGERRCWGQSVEWAYGIPTGGISWDQETLHKEAALMACSDRSYVYGTDANGNLRICE